MKLSYEELEAKCAALASENAGLKEFCKDAAFDADYEAQLGMERGGFTDALNNIKTPATDAFLAEVRAQGEVIDKCLGIFGRLFGHSLKPVITKGALKCQPRLEGTQSFVIRALDAHRDETYHGLYCKRCGKGVKS